MDLHGALGRLVHMSQRGSLGRMGAESNGYQAAHAEGRCAQGKLQQAAHAEGTDEVHTCEMGEIAVGMSVELEEMSDAVGAHEHRAHAVGAHGAHTLDAYGEHGSGAHEAHIQDAHEAHWNGTYGQGVHNPCAQEVAFHHPSHHPSHHHLLQALREGHSSVEVHSGQNCFQDA